MLFSDQQDVRALPFCSHVAWLSTCSHFGENSTVLVNNLHEKQREQDNQYSRVRRSDPMHQFYFVM